VLNALGCRLQRGMHMLRQLHLGLGAVDAVGVQELAENVARIEEGIARLPHARIHRLLEI